MIACRTIIGFGMPGREGTQKAHSDAPGAEVVARRAQGAGLGSIQPFVVPDDLLEPMARHRQDRRQATMTPGLKRKAASKRAQGIRRHHQ